MPKALHRLANRAWYGNSYLVTLLLPLSAVYGLVTWLRRRRLQAELQNAPRLPVPVVVVGNITTGGTGKSPVVAWLADRLAARGMRPGIVSRGYGGARDRQPLHVTARSDPQKAGDEPVMLARMTECPVCVSSDRVAAVETLVRDRDVDVVISDDGLQHYRLPRCFEIAVIDGSRGLGNGWLLPAGPLREPAGRLAEVDAVLVNGPSNVSSVPKGALSFDLVPAHARRLTSDETRPLSSFAGETVWAVAGIGNPERFYGVLERAGIRADTVDVPDHGTCSLDALLVRRRQAIVMTEKDAVKYSGIDLDDVWYVPVTLEFPTNKGEQLIDEVLHSLEAVKA